MNETTFTIAVIYIAMTLPLLVMAGNKTKPAAIILAALFLSPIIGWIIYLLLDDTKSTTAKSKGQQKLERLQRSTYGQRSEDPIEAWEREQRIQQGPPPRPPHIHLE